MNRLTREGLEEELRHGLHGDVLSVSGPIGGFSVRTTKNGTISVGERPTVKHEPTSLQKAQHRRFKRAAAYARKAMARADLKAVYESADLSKGISPFSLAVQDYLLPPAIESVNACNYTGRKGDVISICVRDKFPPARISVVIRSGCGRILERGMVSEVRFVNCLYVARKNVRRGQKVRIKVTVTDHAGHSSSTTFCQELIVGMS
jgi:hypothetical protein